MPGPVFLTGDRVELRTVEREDREFIARHRNNPAFRRVLGDARPMNLSAATDYFESVVVGDDGETFLICADDRAVGLCFFYDLDETNGSAEVGYWITPEAQGNGYATDAARTLARYAFDERRLVKLTARVREPNEASIRVLEKLGFREEGVLREQEFVDGRRVDLRLFGLLASELER
ncbi:GNAT family N-acetyltransferase [Haloprofundus sp. MHR1]|uniref:GNAT family N-acetyltransferase n=1 Tax=Haloprofundus sp. MHR1 TaxID=2572921 RepID=UPI0010BEAF4D|nr:GNAT family protein [Haloprofundus sp. MHR1]QCJ46891.1 GNAT family N-acetyltransferase [Haloprofundus sp. MHR1]